MGRSYIHLAVRERCCRYNRSMSRLQRFYGAGHLHFITCSCYRRMPLLRSARKRDQFLALLEQVRKRCRFVVVGAGGSAFALEPCWRRLKARVWEGVAAFLRLPPQLCSGLRQGQDRLLKTCPDTRL